MELDAEWVSVRSVDELASRCLTLWSAVVRLAAADAIGEIRLNRRGPALQWFLSGDTHPSSFLWCCDILGIHAERVRSALRRKHKLLYQGVSNENFS